MKQEKAMSWTFVNFSQVKTETATTPQVNTFGFKRIHYDIFFNPNFFSLDVEPMDDSARIYEFVYVL